MTELGRSLGTPPPMKVRRDTSCQQFTLTEGRMREAKKEE